MPARTNAIYRGMLAGLIAGNREERAQLDASYDADTLENKLLAVMEALDYANRQVGSAHHMLLAWISEALARTEVPETLDAQRRLLWTAVHAYKNQSWNTDQRTRLLIRHIMVGGQGLLDRVRHLASA